MAEIHVLGRQLVRFLPLGPVSSCPLGWVRIPSSALTVLMLMTSTVGAEQQLQGMLEDLAPYLMVEREYFF